MTASLSPAASADAPDLPPRAHAGPHRVVIIGGGFAGMNAAQALKGEPVKITLIDRRNHHLFQPLLYQVATGGLSPANIASPLRGVFRRQENVEVLMADVVDFDTENRVVKVVDEDVESVPYDTLVVAAGSGNHYFGNDDWEVLAPGLKSLEEATTIRRRILNAFEIAEWEPKPEERAAWLRFVVVGAGPTGCELAGAISEIARHALKRDFRHIRPEDAEIIIIDPKQLVLAAYPDKLREKAERQLENLHVTIRHGGRVTAIDDCGVTVGFKETGPDGEETVREERIPTYTVLWAAGTKASGLGQRLADRTGCEVDRRGAVMVERTLTVPGHPEIFVLGDLANLPILDEETGEPTDQPHPWVAQFAIQGGKYAAKAIRRRLDGLGHEVEAFKYRDLGQMAVLGRAAAVAQVGKSLKLSGFVAWLAWLFIHLMYLVKFSNRLLVFIQWGINYLTFSRSSRLITGDWQRDPGTRRLESDNPHEEGATTAPPELV